MTLRVLLADDHPVVRRGLGALLATVDGVEVVGEAADGEQAVRSAGELTPDVVVMDLQMPGMSGVEATRAVLAASPRSAVLVLTMFDDDESVFAAMRAGARGYLVKGADTADVLRAIEAVAAGEAIFGPSVAARVLAYLTRPLSAFDAVVFPELTEREREVLELMAKGRSNSEIAGRLSLSGKTVRNLVSSTFGKLQVADRAEAIVRARRAGIGLEGAERG